MAEIKMSYIFIEKQKHESKEMQEIEGACILF